jgi:hypothetical protein
MPKPELVPSELEYGVSVSCPSPSTNFQRWPRSRFLTPAFACILLLFFLPTKFLFFNVRVPKPIEHELGVGFHLTSPYGFVPFHVEVKILADRIQSTAAVSYPNSTIINIAKIDGTTLYNEVMFRLSQRSSRHIQYDMFLNASSMCSP